MKKLKSYEEAVYIYTADWKTYHLTKKGAHSRIQVTSI